MSTAWLLNQTAKLQWRPPNATANYLPLRCLDRMHPATLAANNEALSRLAKGAFTAFGAVEPAREPQAEY